MADATIESAVLENGVLTVTGSGFTRTTTTVKVDGQDKPFEIPDDVTDGSKLTVADVAEGAAEVEVTKNGVSDTGSITGPTTGSSAAGGSGTAAGGTSPDTVPGTFDEKDGMPATPPSGFDQAANAGAPSKDPNAPDRTPLEPGAHLPGADFRTKVENTAAGDLNWDPREPYPVGNPPEAKEEFRRIHGYYKDEAANEPTPGGTP